MKYSLRAFFTACLTNIVGVAILVLFANTLLAQGSFESAPIKRNVRWNYGGYTFTLELSFRQSDYYFYKAKPRTLPYSTYAGEYASHPYLVELAKELYVDAQALGYNNSQLAAYLTAFVQNAIPYVSDPKNIGSDFPRFPIETIVDGHGDCEDKAALLTALLKVFNFDVVMLLLPGHMAVGIACPNCNSYYEHKGMRYTFIEAATGGWAVGSFPDEYRKANATILETPEVDHFHRDDMTARMDQGKIKDNTCQCPPQQEKKSEPLKSSAYVIINGVRYELKVTTIINADGSVTTIYY